MDGAVGTPAVSADGGAESGVQSASAPAGGAAVGGADAADGGGWGAGCALSGR